MAETNQRASKIWRNHQQNGVYQQIVRASTTSPTFCEESRMENFEHMRNDGLKRFSMILTDFNH
jgi:hypothetical protein